MKKKKKGKSLQQQTLYIVMALTSALISAAAAWYVRQRRGSAGATSFSLFMLSLAIWSFGYAMELAGTELGTMRFWLRFEYLGIAFLPFWVICFALQYAGHAAVLTGRTIAVLLIIPLITLLLNWTTEMHGLFYRAISLDRSGGITVLALEKGIWYWVHIVYIYGAYVLMAALLLRMFRLRGKLYRRQAFIVVFAMAPPLVGNLLYLTDLSPFHNLDLSPLIFTVTGILIIWALYRYRLLQVVPVARDMLVERMHDGVLVLDGAGCIVDVNPAALKLMGLEGTSPIGRHIDALFPQWVEMLAHKDGGGEKERQEKLERGDAVQYLDIRSIGLMDAGEPEGGALVIIRDVTVEKQLEAQREALVVDLQNALAQVKTLSGLLPICAHCKKIRDDSGYWHQIEAYVRDHSEADFSHSLCPDCCKVLYPELFDKEEPDDGV